MLDFCDDDDETQEFTPATERWPGERQGVTRVQPLAPPFPSYGVPDPPPRDRYAELFSPGQGAIIVGTMVMAVVLLTTVGLIVLLKLV